VAKAFGSETEYIGGAFLANRFWNYADVQ
jgi:hypothetical protein